MEKVEPAQDEMEVGLALDALVAECVMGWLHVDEDEPFRLHKDRGGVIARGMPGKFTAGLIPRDWRPSWYIADAWDVMLKLCSRGLYPHVTTGGQEEIVWTCKVDLNAGEWEEEARHVVDRAESAQLAICRAALKAVGDTQ